MKIIGGMDGSPSPCSRTIRRIFGTRLALQQGLGHRSAAGLLQLTQSLRLHCSSQETSKSGKNVGEMNLHLFFIHILYIYILMKISPSGPVICFHSLRPFPLASPPPCLAFEAHSSHSLHRSLQDRCQAFHQSLQALLQTSSVNLSTMSITHG